MIQWWSAATVLKAKDCDFKRSVVALHSTPLVCTLQLYSLTARKVCYVVHATQFPWVRLCYITWNHFSFRPEIQFGRTECHFNCCGIHPFMVYQSKLTYVNHNKVLLVSSIYATSFGRADRPQALKYITLKQKIKCICMY